MNIISYKQKLLNELYAPYLKCTECPLGTQGRTKVVFGSGNPDSSFMLIGEGPGQEEDRQGLPFVGRSGKLLNKVFELLGIERESIFITNVVKCRPPQNRKPFENEMLTCTNLFLFKQIKIIRPKVICTLGATALQGLINNFDIKISKIRGKPIKAHHIPEIFIMPTFHPAYILRNPKEFNTLFDDIKRAYFFSLESYNNAQE